MICSRFLQIGLFGLVVTGTQPAAHGGDDKAVADALKPFQLELTAKELIQVQSELRKTQLELAFWKAREEAFSKVLIPKSALEERLGYDPLVVKNAARIAELREQITGIEGAVAPTKAATMLKDLRNQLASAEQRADALKGVLRPQIMQQMRDKAFDEYQGKLTQFQEQIDWLKELDKSLTAEVQRLIGEQRTMPSAAEHRLGQVENELRELKAAVAELKKAK